VQGLERSRGSFGSKAATSSCGLDHSFAVVCGNQWGNSHLLRERTPFQVGRTGCPPIVEIAAQRRTPERFSASTTAAAIASALGRMLTGSLRLGKPCLTSSACRGVGTEP
jgi:hypothetical protein